MESTDFVSTHTGSYPSFPAAFEQVALGIAYTSLEGRWLGMNERVCTITGYTREELQQRTVEEMLSPEERARDAHLRERLYSPTL